MLAGGEDRPPTSNGAEILDGSRITLLISLLINDFFPSRIAGCAVKIVPNRAYVDIFMELMKKIVGNGVWKLYLGKGVNEREDKNQFIQDFSLSDETFLFWMLDAYWNKWIQQMRPDLGDQIVNDLISKESNLPEEVVE